jgi:hypothetical protein
MYLPLGTLLPAKSRLLRLLPLTLLLLCGSAFAQETGTILGTVTDPTGAAVPNARIAVTNTASGTTRNVTSNQDGNYNVPDLNIGSYSVKAEAPGFKSYEQTGITLNVNAVVRVNVGLQIGQAQESVTVEATAVAVQSDTSEQSSVITGTQIQNIDTNGRNPVQLATLVPGAASSLPDFNAPTALSSNNNISFNGERPQHNLWMVDGGETYDRGSGGGMIVNPSPDAIGEFRVLTSNYSAEFGSASGGTISMAIKSGTNRFTGTLWEFNRNDALDAKDYFANLSGTAKPKLRYNAFGFNLGGPLFIPKLYNRNRNKTHFFYNMEWRRLIQGSQIYATAIPTSAFSGNFAGLGTITVPQTSDPAAIAKFAAYGLRPGQQFTGNVIPAGLLDPNALAFLNSGAIPKPNTPDGAHYSQAAPVPTNLREEIVRIDHSFTDKIQLMGHLIYDSSENNYATTLWNTSTYPTIGTLLNAPSYSTVVRLTYSITPTVVNELTYNFNGNKLGIVPTGNYAKPSGYNVPEYYPANNLNRLPVININAPYNIAYNTGSWPWNNVYSAHQVNDNLTLVRGNHNLVFGGMLLRGYKRQDIFGNTNGSYTFDGSYTGNGFADFLLGYAKSYSELAIQDAEDTSFTNIGAYAVDNWRVSNRLTLNLGLRWEGMPHAYDVNNRLANFQAELYNPANRALFNPDNSLNTSGPGFGTVSGIPLSSTPFYLNGITLAGRNGTPNGLVKNYWNNWGPRVGFAYDVTGNQKTIIRAGFGMFYERVQGNDIYNMGGNPPFSYTPSANNVYFSNPLVSNQTGATATRPIFPSSLTTLAYSDYKLPTSMQYSFAIQRQLSSAAVMQVSYVGTHGYHQPDARNINPVPLNDPNRLAICGGNCGYTGASYDPNRDRIYGGFGAITMTEAATGTNYNSLQVSLNWRNRSGLSLQGAYTYSHALDYVSADLNTMSNPFNRAYDYGSGDFDRRHIAVISYVYDLPFFKGSTNGFLHSVVGGWTISGITMFESGTPLTATLSYDNLGLGGTTTSRPDFVGSLTYPKTRLAWFNASAFGKPAPLAFGNEGRNVITGPGRNNWNVALFKVFAVPGREGMRLEIRGETYNTFNHTQFNAVNTTYGNSNFGQVTSVWDPRVIQLSGKFYF